MREMHCKLCMPISAICAVLLLGLFLITGSQAFADERLKEKAKITQWQNQKEREREYQKNQQEIERENRKHNEEQARESRKYEREQEREAVKHRQEMRDLGDHDKRLDYYKHPGYRERPYDKRLHYVHQDHHGHRYNYQGHWRSWEEWDKYAK
ncbi:MAG: hypothetical protein ACOWYE_00690, partial [Desulfatiglandales bacterium]